MGRPPLGPGEHGTIGCYRDDHSGRVRARATFRDYDGHYRPVTRWGTCAADARARLLAALEERASFPAGQWATGAKVCEVVPLWRCDLTASPLAPSTRQLYTAAARLYVQPAVGDLRLGETRAERQVVDAIGAARAAGLSWARVGGDLGRRHRRRSSATA